MKKIIPLFLIVFVSSLSAKNLDSLYNKFLQIRERDFNGRRIASSESEPIKCSFGIISEIRSSFNSFSAKQKLVLNSLLSRPITDTSIISPSGKFRINFNKSGNNKPAYSVDETAKIADYVYKSEIDSLRYPAPQTGTNGFFDIYIHSLGYREYGYTDWDSLTENSKATICYMVLNSDYSSMPTTGLNAVKVTIAHEFHHAIQACNYIFREADRYFMELTSTSMEDIVYNNVNDYYNYLPNYFQQSVKAINNYDGYELAIWNLFLRDKYGVDILKEIWELMPTQRAVQCFETVLEKHGSSFMKEFNEFGIWTYFTNFRTMKGKYFKEAANYPLMKMGMTASFTNSTTFTVNSLPVTNNFIQADDGANSIVSVVTNADIQNSISSGNVLPFNLSISTNQSSGFAKIYDGYYSKLSSNQSALLTDSYFFNGKLVNKIENMSYAYPQPFFYSKHSLIYLPAELTSDNSVELNIYSVDMNLVYNGNKSILAGDRVVVGWNVLDNNGKKLGTGVYFYVIKCGDNILKGKFAVIND